MQEMLAHLKTMKLSISVLKQLSVMVFISKGLFIHPCSNDNSGNPSSHPAFILIFSYPMSLIDGTTKRFKDNSKLVVVEGPPALDKTKFAKGEINDSIYNVLWAENFPQSLLKNSECFLCPDSPWMTSTSTPTGTT